MDNPCKNCLIYPVCLNRFKIERNRSTTIISLLHIAGRCTDAKKFFIKYYETNRGKLFNPFTKTEVRIFEADWLFLNQIPEGYR